MHLAAAAEGGDLSEYHLQAGIAAIHCTAPDSPRTDWALILRHYDELFRLKPSPIVALNRAVAVAHAAGPQPASTRWPPFLIPPSSRSHYLLHAVTGELHWLLKNERAAAESFRRALQLGHVGPEQGVSRAAH